MTWAPPAAAAVFDPLHLVHSEQVTGDFDVIGNGVLVCPSTDATARAECLGASQRQNGFNNNRFAMQYADVDADPTTYDSSSAQVTLPAGSRVTYARLSWGGNRDGQQCGIGQPGSYPPGGSATQAVRLTVGDRPSVDVAPTSYTTDTTSIGYYSADAEVTARFAGLTAGEPVTVTVADVYAPQGFGCHGGWSLTLVHTDDDAGCTTPRREVFVYDGHVRQGVADAPVDVPVDGFRVSGGPARVGVTAYEGDNGQNGDQLLLNGTPLADPATGSTTNFFDSTALGQVAPAYPNNFSVDAKTLAVPGGVVPVGSTSATLQIRTTADAFMLQSLVLSVPVPSLCLGKSVSPAVAHAGDPVTWTLRLTNPTGTDATGVQVDDPAVPGCARTVGAFPAGSDLTWTCASVATDDLTNLATASGSGAGGITLSDTGSAALDVIHPAITVDKTASVAAGLPGDPVTWTVVVTNSGDTTLDPVTVDDDLVDSCDRAGLGPLAAGAVTTYSCRSVLASTDVVNRVVAQGTDSLGLTVRGQAQAAVHLERPAVGLTQAPDVPRVVPGEPVVWTLTATNPGTTPLTDVQVADPRVPGCERSFADLAIGVTRTWTCRETAGHHDLVNDAMVSARPPSGPAVTDGARGTVVVLVPDVFVTVSRSGDADDAAAPDEAVVRIVATDPGDTHLTAGRIEVTGAPDCDRQGLALAPGRSLTLSCAVAVPTATVLAVRVTFQPTLAGQAVGRPVDARDRLRLTPILGPTLGGPGDGDSTLPSVGGGPLLLPATWTALVCLGAGALLLGVGRRRRRGER